MSVIVCPVTKSSYRLASKNEDVRTSYPNGMGISDGSVLQYLH